MATVTYANLFSEPRNNILSLISNSSNVSDPVIFSSEYRKWIYSRFPDVKSSSFKGYPFIVIKSSDLDIETLGGTGDGKSKVVNFDIDIEVYTSDRGYGSSDGNGLSNMEAISDDIMETLMNVTNRNTLRIAGLSSAGVSPTDISEEVQSDEILYKRIIPVSFTNRLTVSA